jgi:hypothetical protein
VNEQIHADSRLKKLVIEASENNTLKRVIADGAYDNKENFRYFHDNGIEAANRVRKNSSYGSSRSCYPRKIKIIVQ